jgi:uncharacterized repeat protein (TIGR03803 family)
MRSNRALARSVITGTCLFLFVLVSGAWAQYTVLTSFDYSNGYEPIGTPHIDRAGDVFGTTNEGGEYGCGAVYVLVDVASVYTNETIYSFTCGLDGGYPYGSVTLDADGNLYGVATEYGANDNGTVYELVNDGDFNYTFELLYTFTGGSDGGYPNGDLLISKDAIYGATYEGGGGGCEYGCGTVFKLTKKHNSWSESVVHVFNYEDGAYPYAGVIADSKGNLYGTTYEGGGFALGVVYKLSPEGKGYKETVLHSFDGSGDGCDLYSGVVMDSAGNLYGAAEYCGLDYDGTVYQLQPDGKGYSFRVLLAFDYTNGEEPEDDDGHVAVDSAGNVYGTAEYGGAYGYGTVFRLAAPDFVYTDLHDFDDNGTDGYDPEGGVSLDSSGNLYGTTLFGGTDSEGTVWQITSPSTAALKH